MPREPLYPHIPGTKEPLFPHVPKGRQPEGMVRREGDWVYVKVGTTEVRGKEVPTGILIEQVSPTSDQRDFGKAVEIIEKSFGVAVTKLPTPRYEFFPESVRRKLPPIGATGEQKDPIAQVKFFTPWTNWTWYGLEFDGKDIFFGWVVGLEKEFGSFSLSELQSLKGPLGLKIERDIYFEPKPISQVMKEHGETLAMTIPKSTTYKRIPQTGIPRGTEVYVEKLPKCDFCDKPALYDAKTTMGPWAHMCQDHYLRYGIGLGVGKGQKLIPRKALGEAEKLRGEPGKELSVRMTEADFEAATLEDMWYPVCPYCGASTPAEPDAHAIYCQACNRRFKIFNPFFSLLREGGEPIPPPRILGAVIPQDLVEKVRELWNKACEWDKIPPDSKFVVFSDDNPFVKEYNEAVGQLLRYQRFRTGEWQPATTVNLLAATEGDPLRKFCCRQCGECAPTELLEEGRFPERIDWLRHHYKEKHPGIWGKSGIEKVT